MKKLISIASGKGGTGKTTIAIALGHHLSTCEPTVLVDFDLFNRGVTEVFSNVVPIRTDIPDLAEAGKLGDILGECRIVQVSTNLYVLRHDMATAEQVAQIDAIEPSELVRNVAALARVVAETVEATCVVLDCHGGRDNLSLAAMIAADDALLLAAPEIVTFRGTRNFLTSLRRYADNMNMGETPIAPKIIFNLMGDDIRVSRLQHLFRRFMQPECPEAEFFGGIPRDTRASIGLANPLWNLEAHPFSLFNDKIRLIVAKLRETPSRDHRPESAIKVASQTLWLKRLVGPIIENMSRKRIYLLTVSPPANITAFCLAVPYFLLLLDAGISNLAGSNYMVTVDLLSGSFSEFGEEIFFILYQVFFILLLWLVTAALYKFSRDASANITSCIYLVGRSDAHNLILDILNALYRVAIHVVSLTFLASPVIFASELTGFGQVAGMMASSAGGDDDAAFAVGNIMQAWVILSHVYVWPLILHTVVIAVRSVIWRRSYLDTWVRLAVLALLTSIYVSIVLNR